MTLVIENVKEEFVPAFKGLAKGVQAKVRAKKTRAEIIAEMERESEEMTRLYKEGKLKTFSSMEEYRQYRGIK
ncbi:hypothetical protein [uncultured Helicobacter sp.]|uniref:hypothetical protein n=1 Tax=uncultured Helicobacter sp. TaxID=175537 RepID=UPI003752C1A3